MQKRTEREIARLLIVQSGGALAVRADYRFDRWRSFSLCATNNFVSVAGPGRRTQRVPAGGKGLLEGSVGAAVHVSEAALLREQVAELQVGGTGDQQSS